MADGRINELRDVILEANAAYAEGSPIMKDSDYDKLVEELLLLSPNDPVAIKIGSKAKTRNEAIPIPMFSLDKVKTIETLLKWAYRNGISMNDMMCISPKLDGISMCGNELSYHAWTRGDGIEGQRSDEHFKYIGKRKGMAMDVFTYGEAIMSKNKFRKYATIFKNARNLVGGKINADKIDTAVLLDTDYIRYGINQDKEKVPIYKSKVYMLSVLNKVNVIPIQYTHIPLREITKEYLETLYSAWRADYSIDGVVIEIDDQIQARKLGRQDNGNPKFAIAYKGFEEENQVTTIENIEWQITKHGKLKPVAVIDPVILDGVEVSRATLYNARNAVSKEMGVDSVIRIKRSGMVIPKVIEVLNSAIVTIPSKCPECEGLVDWDADRVDLICTNESCRGTAIMKIVAFFEIIGVEDFGEGVIRRLFEHGFTSIKTILSATASDLKEVESFADKKATNLIENIKKRTLSIPMERLQHASSYYVGLGEKTLEVIMDGLNKGVELTEIEGIGETTANVFWNGHENFVEFYDSIKHLVKIEEKRSSTDGKMSGWVVVMTGFRDEELDKRIKSEGGRIGSSVTGSTTHLICRAKGSHTTKEEQAKKKKVPIYTINEFNELMSKL